MILSIISRKVKRECITQKPYQSIKRDMCVGHTHRNTNSKVTQNTHTHTHMVVKHFVD